MAYITYIGRHVKEIACKGCRKVIAARRGPAQNLRLDLLDGYCVMEIEVLNPDGQLAKHQTPMCIDCCRRLSAPPTAETHAELTRLYAEDMEQHHLTTVRAGYPVEEVKRMVARFSDRRPIRALGRAA